MSEQSLDALRLVIEKASQRADRTGRAIDALDPQSMAPIYESLDSEVELHEDPRFPEAGIYRGIAAVRAYWEQFAESFDEFTFEAEDLIGLEDGRVLVLFRLLSRGKDSGARVEANPGWIFTLSDGRVVRIETYLDRGEALQVSGQD